MRLLYIILLLAASAQAQGQAFWFTGRGGVSFNNAPSGISRDYYKDVQGGTGWLAGVTASVEIKKWLQVGIGFDRVVRNYSYTSPLEFRSFNGPFHYNYDVRSHAFSGYVFANYRYMLGRSFVYAGVQGGDFQVLREDINSYRSDYPNTIFYAGSSSTTAGAFVGGQAGFSYHIKGNWSLQGEVAARYRPWATMYVVVENGSGQQDYLRRNSTFAYYPVTLSIAYRLNTARHKHIEIPKAEVPAEDPEEEVEE